MALTVRRWAICLAFAASFCSSAWGQLVIGPAGQIDLSSGSFTTGCLSVVNQGNLALGSGLFSTGSFTQDSSATISGSGGTLNVSGNFSASAPISLSSSTLVLSDSCAPGSAFSVSGTVVVQNLTLLSTTATPATFTLPAGTNITVLGTVTLGSPGHPVLLTSSGPAVAVVTLVPGATVQNPSGSTIPTNVRFDLAGSAQAIPALNTYGLILLSLAIGALLLHVQRRLHTRNP